MKRSHNLSGQEFGIGKVISQTSRPEGLVRNGFYWLVKCQCGETRTVDTTTLKRKWTSCGCLTESNLIGKRFEKGVVKSLVGTDGKNNKLWKLDCDCGNSYTATTNGLIYKNNKSCGCLSKRIGKDHPHYKGYNDLSGDYWAKLKKGARIRNIEFDITMVQAWDLFVSQDQKCALTGWSIELSSTKHKEQTASLDRIDSDGCYEVDNVQWVHKDINRAKQNFPEDYFFKLCEAVTATRRTSLD